MKKHAARHVKARMIRAAQKCGMIQAEAVAVEWIQAAEGESADKPIRFTMTAYTGGPMRVDGYYDPVVIDLEGLEAKPPFPSLRDHDMGQIVGHIDEAEIGSVVKVGGIISGANEFAAQVVSSSKAGFPWKASIGAMPAANGLEFIGDGISTKVNGKSFKGPLIIARKATVREVSFVAIGADAKTSVKVAASAANSKEIENMKPELQTYIEAMGLVVSELRDDTIAKIKTKYDADLKAATEAAAIKAKATEKPPEAVKVEPPAFDLRSTILCYEKHVAIIQAKAAEYAGKIDAAALAPVMAKAQQDAAQLKLQALKEEWSPVKLEAAYVMPAAIFAADLMGLERPKGPAIHGSPRDLQPQVIEAAFAQSCGLKQPEKHYKPEILEAADKHFRNIGIQEVLLIHAQAAGYAGRQKITVGNLREVMNAAFSTHTLTTLLTTTGNKILLEGFNQIPQSWREIAEIGNVVDFKTVTRFRLTADMQYEEVGAAGELKHGTVGQETYTMAAKTYGKMAAFTRQDIINDDLGALNAVRSRLGLGGAIKLQNVFWTVWIDNTAFFTGARANLVTGSTLGDTGLATAIAAFRNMAGPDGNKLNLEPAVLLVPPSLEATARKFYVSQELRDTSASTRLATANIYYNRFRPVVVPELETASFGGAYSASTWYLLAAPTVLATAVMCFLDGQQAPTIESSDADFDTLGIQFRAYHDFGAAFSEYRAGVKATA